MPVENELIRRTYRFARRIFLRLPESVQLSIRRLRDCFNGRRSNCRPSAVIPLGHGEVLVIDAVGVEWAEVEARLAGEVSESIVVVTDVPVMHDVRERPQMFEFLPTINMPSAFRQQRFEEIVRVYGAVRMEVLGEALDPLR